MRKVEGRELIDTLWNVKEYQKMMKQIEDPELIDTQ